MDCKYIKDHLYDYYEGQLENSVHVEFENHLKYCNNCQKEFMEIQKLMETLHKVSDHKPDLQLENEFLAVLAEEKALSGNSLRKANTRTVFISVLKYASIILLMFSCYYLGYFAKDNRYRVDVASLKQEKTELKSLMTLALLENESASKRIQGLHFAQELSHPEDEILDLLFNKMKYDDHISVRLASAQALKKFSMDDQVVLQFLKTLELEKDITMQLELIEILVDIKEKRAIPIMKELLQDQYSPEYVKEQIQLELTYLT